MLKLYLKLRATKDMEKAGWTKGEVYEMINDVFDKNTGLAYFPIDNDWEILKMEIKEYKPVSI